MSNSPSFCVCMICKKNYNSLDVYSHSGCHSVCKQCWSDHLHQYFVIQKRSFLDVICIVEKCGFHIPLEDLRYLFSSQDVNIFDSVLDTIPDTMFPSKLDNFNYEFDNQGRLRHKNTVSPFHYISEHHYDALGDAIVKYIQELLRKEGLDPISIPINSSTSNYFYDSRHSTDISTPRIKIFMSRDAIISIKPLLVLLQGSGAVRPGQWARALCINESLNEGSQLPYILRAKSLGWNIMILNPNEGGCQVQKEKVKKTESRSPSEYYLGREGMRKCERKRSLLNVRPNLVSENETPSAHLNYVWKHFLSRSNASSILLVAHSAGGEASLNLLRSSHQSRKFITALALTDSIHRLRHDETQQLTEWLHNNSLHFIASRNAVGTPEKTKNGCPCLSSGHIKHEWTSFSAKDHVFKFFLDKLKFSR